MGGLVGVVHLDGESPERARVEAMLDQVKVRGPDSVGLFEDPVAVLGQQTRQLSEGRQVMPLVTDDLVLLLDGWIYDHEALGEHITGPAAPDAGDAKTLLAAWRRWGRSFVDHVEGDFAAAVWDRKAKVLHLVRDRFGIRPLYWTKKGKRFAFASSLPALLSIPWVRSEPDRNRLAEYLSFAVVHAPRTLMEDVRQVEAGHWLQFDADQMVTRRWWSLQYAPRGTARPRDAEIIDTVQASVQRAVRRRVPKDSEVGLYLSGGLGSTAIAAASRRLNMKLPTFTISFADDPYPESPFAGRVARLLGLEHHEIVVGSADVAAIFDPTVAALGHPIGNPTALLQALLARAAGDRVRVVLSGDGGPELFGGRMLDRFQQQLRTSRLAQKMPRTGRRVLGRLLGERGRALVTAPEKLALSLGIGGANLFPLSDRQAVLANPAWVRDSVRQDVLRQFHANIDTDAINTGLHGFLRSWLGEGALTRADRTAAAAGVDIRFPLLDREIATYAASLPGSVKVRRVGGSLHTRWPLRAMLDGVLPAPLVNRPRRGMPTPPDSWLVNAGRLFFEERWQRLLEDPHQLFSKPGLQRMRARLPGDPRTALQFWSLFILDSWLRTLKNG